MIKEVPNLSVQLIDRKNDKKVNINSISSYYTYRILVNIQEIDENSKDQFVALDQKFHQQTRALVADRIRH